MIFRYVKKEGVCRHNLPQDHYFFDVIHLLILELLNKALLNHVHQVLNCNICDLFLPGLLKAYK